MSIEEKKIGQSQISSVANTTLYTLPAGKKAIVRTIMITNTTAIDAVISLWIVPNGGASGDGNAFLKTVNIPANDFLHFHTYLILETEGDTIQAKAGTATAISITMFGAELTD